MIPKIIHYCWFSGEKKPDSIKRCIDSWRRVLTDFEIRCWDKDSFDFDSVPFTKEALSVKKYAFAADYVRLYALYHEGGVYLDSDVEVYKNFSPLLLDCDFFSGTEALDVEGKTYYRMEAAIMGSRQGHPFIKDCLNYYQQQHFINTDGTLNSTVMPSVISQIGSNYEYQPSNLLQHLPCGMTIYPTSYFTNSLITNTDISTQFYAKHCNAASWMDFKDRGKFFHFCRKHDMMGIYHWVEKFKK